MLIKYVKQFTYVNPINKTLYNGIIQILKTHEQRRMHLTLIQKTRIR